MSVYQDDVRDQIIFAFRFYIKLGKQNVSLLSLLVLQLRTCVELRVSTDSLRTVSVTAFLSQDRTFLVFVPLSENPILSVLPSACPPSRDQDNNNVRHTFNLDM